MPDRGAAIAFALFVWWFTTGIVLLLDGLPRRTYRLSLYGATLAALGALVMVGWSMTRPTLAGAYAAFSAAVIVWAWAEMTFLMGGVTGSRRTACAPQCSGVQHFLHGIQAILHHELLLLSCLGVLLVVTWDQPNRVAAWTFLALWCMRQSSKLNLFLGVRNSGAELLPEHLQYLRSFFRQRRMNALFPLSMLVAGAAMTRLVQLAISAPAESFEAVGTTLVASMLALGILEHVMLMLPIPSTALWGWALRSRKAPATPLRAAARPD